MTSRHRALHRQDRTARDLIAEARAYGAMYLPIDGVIDGILLFRDRPPILVDWKAPKAKRTARQMKLVLEGWPIFFVENSDQLRQLLFGKAA
jgi:hypothetical protein